FRPYSQTMTIDGFSFEFYVGDVIGRRWYGGTAVRGLGPEMQFVKDRVIQPGDIALDCGAHHGMNTILLAHWVGAAGQVIDFEALKGAQRVLASRPKFVIEVHTRALANFDTNVEELLSLIDLDAYDVWIQWKENDAPVPYRKTDRITDRVHLFGLPRVR